MRSRHLPVVIGMIACCSPVCLAHLPFFSDGSEVDADHASVIADVDLSQVVYHEVTSPGQLLWLAFDAAAGQEFYFNIGVPAIERPKAYRPAVALIGPGLPAAHLPFPIPAGLGATVFTTDSVTEPEFFHEPFSGTDSWILTKQTVPLATAGRYYAVGYVPSGQVGKFWVAIGKREQFGLEDILKLTGDLPRVRAYHESSATESILPPCFFLPLGVVACFLGLRAVARRFG